MKFVRAIQKLSVFVLHASLVGLTACGSASPNSPSVPSLYTCTPDASTNVFPGVVSGGNVVSVTVNGTTCSPGAPSYQNEPCVSVRVCDSTSACVDIPDILVDTGSYGLRIFKQTLNAAPGNPTFYGNLIAAQENAGIGKLAECVVFGDLSSEFGPVVTAKSIILGSETASNIPMMIIDSTYSGGATGTPCSASQSHPDTAPTSTGFNGILGVGVFQYDGGNYYSCSGGSCSSTNVTSITPSLQVQNPVASFTTDNNGVILTFPAISSNGVVSADGYLIFGINTAANNASTNVKGYKADSNAEIQTTFGTGSGTVLPSFIDSGSNAYYFPSPSPYITPDCGNGFFCPSSTLTLTATNRDKTGANPSCVSFQVGNTNALIGDGTRKVFNDLAGNAGSGINGLFDFGLPFFFGREVFIGITGKSSNGMTNVTSGPFFGY